MNRINKKAEAPYALEGYEFLQIPGHEGGRNGILICRKGGENRYVLRISAPEDRTEERILKKTRNA